MKTATYEQIKNLAAELAQRTRENLPSSEATMLLSFLNSELRDIWNKAQWEELCDNVEAVSLTNGAFSKREGDSDEMGDILGIFVGGDPRTSTNISKLRHDEFMEGDNTVHVISDQASVYVDWQDPVPDLVEIAGDDGAESDTLLEYELPRRFLMPLAYRAAAHLLDGENDGLAAKYNGMAEVELQRMEARITQPWFRRVGAGQLTA